MRVLLVLLIAWPFVQEPGAEELIRRLEKTPARLRNEAIEAVVAKGDEAEPLLRARLADAKGQAKSRLALALRRLEIQKKLRALHPAPELIDLDVRDKPIKDLVPDIEKWLGQKIDPGNLPTDLVTLKLVKATPLQALDELHLATGITWGPGPDRAFDREAHVHVSLPPTMKAVKWATTKWPATYRDRRRIGVAQTSLKRGDGGEESRHGFVDLALTYAAGSSASNLEFLTVEKIVDDQGRELEIIPDRQAPFSHFNGGFIRNAFARRIQFAHPEADAKSISLLGGRARVACVVERNWVTFDKPYEQVGTTLEHRGLKVTLHEFGPAHGWMKLTLDHARSPEFVTPSPEYFEYATVNLVEQVEVVHEDGRITRPENNGAKQEGAVYRKRTVCFGTPKVKEIRLSAGVVYGYEDFDFELKDIPLPGGR